MINSIQFIHLFLDNYSLNKKVIFFYFLNEKNLYGASKKIHIQYILCTVQYTHLLDQTKMLLNPSRRFYLSQRERQRFNITFVSG